MNIDTRIAGIPCKVHVDTFCVTRTNYSPRTETPSEYHGEREIEYAALKRDLTIALKAISNTTGGNDE